MQFAKAGSYLKVWSINSSTTVLSQASSWSSGLFSDANTGRAMEIRTKRRLKVLLPIHIFSIASNLQKTFVLSLPTFFSSCFTAFGSSPQILWWIKKRIITSVLANTIYKAVICYCLLELHLALISCSEFKILIPEIHLSFVLITAGSQTGHVRDTNFKDCVREWISKIGSFLGGAFATATAGTNRNRGAFKK